MLQQLLLQPLWEALAPAATTVHWLAGQVVPLHQEEAEVELVEGKEVCVPQVPQLVQQVVDQLRVPRWERLLPEVGAARQAQQTQALAGAGHWAALVWPATVAEGAAVELGDSPNWWHCLEEQRVQCSECWRLTLQHAKRDCQLQELQVDSVEEAGLSRCLCLTADLQRLVSQDLGRWMPSFWNQREASASPRSRPHQELFEMSTSKAMQQNCRWGVRAFPGCPLRHFLVVLHPYQLFRSPYPCLCLCLCLHLCSKSLGTFSHPCQTSPSLCISGPPVGLQRELRRMKKPQFRHL